MKTKATETMPIILVLPRAFEWWYRHFCASECEPSFYHSEDCIFTFWWVDTLQEIILAKIRFTRID